MIKSLKFKKIEKMASPRQKEIMENCGISFNEKTTYEQAYKLIEDRLKKELADSRIKTHPIISAFLRS